MWQYFLHGKTHDLYGLLIMIATNGLIWGVTKSDLVHFLCFVDIIISVGVFVDLWAHNFHH